MRKLNAYPEWSDRLVEALQNNIQIHRLVLKFILHKDNVRQKFQEGLSVVLPKPNQRVLDQLVFVVLTIQQ